MTNTRELTPLQLAIREALTSGNSSEYGIWATVKARLGREVSMQEIDRASRRMIDPTDRRAMRS